MKWMFLFLLLFIGLYFFTPSPPPPSPPGQPEINGHMLKEPKATAGLVTLIGQPVQAVNQQLGRPDRVDPSAYGYEWWVYRRHLDSYVQVGVARGKVVTILAGGERVNVEPFAVGQRLQTIFQTMPVLSNIKIQLPSGTYRFELSEQDYSTRPVVKVGAVYAQLYVDRFTGQVAAVRLMDAETFVKLRPYELVYRGHLPDVPTLSEEQQRMVDAGNAKQIFDWTNLFRRRHELSVLAWDDDAAAAAAKHSRDMHDHQFFSHKSPRYGDLSERLQALHIPFRVAGENIAAHQVDGAEAAIGWLNSEKHREIMMNREFTHLGVGVYGDYYTQNFFTPR
ncbi:CAP domain-containing protein [Caldibacillus thermoamylovorans]